MTVVTSDYTMRIQTTWNHLFIKHILKQCPNLECVMCITFYSRNIWC